MKQAVTRLAVLAVLLLNQVLILFGWNPLPFSEDQIYEAVSSILMVGTAIYTWWKNNNVTPEAEKAQRGLDYMKRHK